jgi:NAD(P)-dependent dehydrogenase (short-subunit alcohol dehydrogenase family)
MGALSDKVVVVTGAGRGLGSAYARLAAQEGARVVVNDIDAAAAADVVAAIGAAGGVAVADTSDISTWDGAEALVQGCTGRFGRIDGLVNNAGIFHLSRPQDETPERIRAIVEVNVLGPVHCGVHALRAMTAQGSGSIVNVTSGAHAGISDMGLYGATKGAVASLTYGWAVDVAGTGVRVNAVSPIAKSRMYDTMLAFKGDGSSDTAIRPEDNAAPVVFLLSDAAAGINGQIVRINPPRLSLIAHPSEVPAHATCAGWTVADVERAFREELKDALQPLGLSAWNATVVS